MSEEWIDYLAQHEPELDALRKRADRPQAWVTCDGCGRRFDRYALYLDHGKGSLLILERGTLTRAESLRADVCSDACRERLTAAWEVGDESMDSGGD